MKRLSLPALLALCLTSSSEAQITVPQNSIESIFTIGRRVELHADTTFDRPKADVGRKGGPHTYDFSDLKLDLFHVDTLKNVSQSLALASRFPGSAIAFGVPNNFDGLDLDAVDFADGKMVSIGGYRQIDTTVFTAYHYNPPEIWFSFPVTYGDSLRDNSQTTDSTFTNGAFTNAGVYTNPMDLVVDGYGTLMLPDGENHQCIRLRKTELPSSNYKGFWFLTNDGLFLVVDSRNSQPDEDSVENNGIFVVRGDSPTSVAPSASAPKSFSLMQNYPNPFNPATTIRFTLGTEEHVVLRISDMLGRSVVTLVDEPRSAGLHSVNWNAVGIGSGVYLISIEAGSFRQTRRMMLIR